MISGFSSIATIILTCFLAETDRLILKLLNTYVEQKYQRNRGQNRPTLPKCKCSEGRVAQAWAQCDGRGLESTEKPQS